MNFLIGILLGTLAYFLLALGFVFQKKGIKIFSAERKPIDFIFWISGLILININPFVNFIALGFVPSYVINAISALTIVFTILLSATLLKEKLFGSDFIYIFAITFLIAVITLKTKDASQNMPVFSLSLIFALAPIVLFLLDLPFVHLTIKGRFKSDSMMPAFSKVIIPSITSGAMAGFMVIAMKLLQLDKGSSLSVKYFNSIYLYLFLLNGLISFIAIQIAYKNGSMIVVAPLQYGFTVLYPVIASLFLFPIQNALIEGLNITALSISIFLCIWGIISKH